MSYDYQRLFAIILDAVAADGPFAERMGRVIDECAVQIPHPDWPRFRALAFDEEAQALSGWLPRAFGASWKGAASQGLWVGLVQVMRDKGMVADMYASASPAFDGESIVWAEDVERAGQESYLDSDVLAAIYRLAYGAKGGLGNDAEYPLALAYGAMATRAALEAGPLPEALSGLRGSRRGL
jgi:hypothetical protein